MEISNDIMFRSPENGDYILLDCSATNVTKNGLYQKLADGRTALKVKINGLNALYVLPIASATTLGGIKVGSGLTIDPTTGVLSATGGGTGTVTSVSSGNLTPLFTVSIANPTTTPSFTFTQVAQASNLVYASPNGSSGVPTFRALVASDIPSLNYVTSVGATAPLTSSGGYTPTLSTSMSTNKLIGRYNSGTGVMEEISLGSGLSLSGGVLTSTNQGGGSSVNYYLNGGTSQGSFSGSTYYQMSKTADTGTGVDFNISADGYIANFITDANDPSLLNIPAGSWNISAYFSASSSGGTPSFYCELYKYDGSTFTLIASSSSTPESISSGTAIDLYVTSLAVPSTTLSITDRLAIRIYVSHSGRTITLHTQDSHLCEIATTFSSGITALNGLTTQVQAFATGTSGTDFGISSSSSTHTFNLPIASALNTGKLSSADWSIFNGKQNALSGTGFVKISGTTISYDNSTYYLASNPNSYIALTDLSAGTGISYNNTTGVISSTITQYTDAMARAAISLTTTGTSGAATYNSTTGVLNIPQYTGGTGTVTNVSVDNLSPLFTASVANPTSTPSVTFALVSQSANLVYASPNGTSGNPSFRSLVATDLPVVTIAKGGTNSSTALSNNRIMVSIGGAIVEQSAITPSRIIISDSNGLPIAADTTTYPDLTELSYVKGVTSSIQTQLNSKLPAANGSVIYCNTTNYTTGAGTAEQKMLTATIPSGTISAGEHIVFEVREVRTTSISFSNIKLYYNTSDSLVGATIIGQFTSGGSVQWVDLRRGMAVKAASGNSQVFNTGVTNVINDYQSSTSASTTITPDFTSTIYFIVSITHTIGTDVSILSLLKITRG